MKKPLDIYYKEAGKDYEIEYFDKQNLDEIRKMLKDGKYKDVKQLRDHMEYLEDLIQRLMRIIQDEEKESINNLSLKHDFSKIKELYDQLAFLLEQLEKRQE